MLILGLTGSIATGKSFVARQFKRRGVAIFDSDQAVRKLLETPHVIQQIAKHFPEAVKKGSLDRAVLANVVFGNRAKLNLLEEILHPEVRNAQRHFLKRARYQRKNIVLLDIPLLFETEAEKRVHRTITTIAPTFLIRHRALKRGNMNNERLSATLARQLPQWQKRKRADHVIHTGIGPHHSLKQVRKILSR